MPEQPVKYRVVLDYLREGILAGRFDIARRLPSEMELSQKFRTSRPTVVRAMQELKTLGLVERRVGSGTYIRRTATPVTGSFGLIVAGLGNTEIMDPICSEITHAAELQHFTIVRGAAMRGELGAESFSPEETETLCRAYVAQSVAGVFFAPVELSDDRQAINLHLAERLEQAGIAVVLLDRDIVDFPARSRFDLIGIDDFAAGLNLASHFITTNRRQLRFVAKPRYPATTNMRMAGCREAMARHGLNFSADLCRIGNPSDLDFVRSVMGPARCDGIICSNDQTAAMLMQSLAKLGIRVPQDVALAGFDDVRYATLLTVPLTTVRQPCRAIGEVAVQMMLERLRTPALPARHVMMSGELIVRQSTATAGVTSD